MDSNAYGSVQNEINYLKAQRVKKAAAGAFANELAAIDARVTELQTS